MSDQSHATFCIDAESGARKTMVPGFFIRIFPAEGTDYHSCWRHAEDWCGRNGVSMGRLQARAPRGLIFGDYDIQQWRNLSGFERGQLHGIGWREGRGAVVLILKACPVNFEDAGPFYVLDVWRERLWTKVYARFFDATLQAIETGLTA